MGRSRTNALIWGLILLIAGLLFLLWNFGVFAGLGDTLPLAVAGVVAALGVGFLIAYAVRRQEWWNVIPGFLLLAVGGIVYLSVRAVAAVWLGATLFFGLALAFAVVYLGDRRERWWALIPFGTLALMAGVILLSGAALPVQTLGAVLFGGMGLVFLLVYLLAPERPRFRWALVPAAVLLVMGVVTLLAGVRQSNPALAPWLRLWPLLLIGLGVALLGMAIARSRPTAEPVTELPAQPPVEAPAAAGTSAVELPETPLRRVERSPIALVDQVPPSPATPGSSDGGAASAG